MPKDKYDADKAVDDYVEQNGGETMPKIPEHDCAGGKCWCKQF